VLADDVYHGNRSLLMQVFEDWGLRWTMVDMTDLEAVERALGDARAAQRTRADRREGGVDDENVVVWTETPSNPLLKVTDIRAIAAICAKVGRTSKVPLIVDATWCTPWICQPLGLGADLVVHSTTKYFGGHSDLTGGALVRGHNVSPAGGRLFDRCRLRQAACGGVPSAFDAWLTLRGLRSLPVRMEAHSRNAMSVARFLDSHPRVSRVHYPGLDAHSGKETMALQSRVNTEEDSADLQQLFGGMVSFQVEGGRDAATRVAREMTIFKRATSLGGTESLVEHRRSVEDDASTTPEDLLRLSVGLESERDLINDLEMALRE
jgi:cystathionine gamma-synthase